MKYSYVKRPIPIQAWLWEGEDKSAFPDFLQNRNDVNVVDGILFVWTLEGVTLRDSPGEHCYIVKGVDGELYTCKPEIFEKSYMPAAECRL